MNLQELIFCSTNYDPKKINFWFQSWKIWFYLFSDIQKNSDEDFTNQITK